MAAEPSAVEQAVSRTLRDNLEKIQRSSEELHQAINDLVSACSSSRPTNALPPMVRAQMSAASISSALEVLSRFVTVAMQHSPRTSFETEIPHFAPPIAIDLPSPPKVQPELDPRHPIEQGHFGQAIPAGIPERLPEPPPVIAEAPAPMPIASVVEVPPPASFVVPVLDVPPVAEMPSPEPAHSEHHVPESVFIQEPPHETVHEIGHEPAHEPVLEAENVFTLDSLAPEEQELHRRAYRVAKVSMQDIKMLRPEDVRLGRENKDLCFRLRDDIEKAHKEYDRRFQSIHTHPVDYFYDWMVEILAGGDAQALGEYPYPSPVLHR